MFVMKPSKCPGPANKRTQHHPFTYPELFLTIHIQSGALIKGQRKNYFHHSRINQINADGTAALKSSRA